MSVPAGCPAEVSSVPSGNLTAHLPQHLWSSYKARTGPGLLRLAGSNTRAYLSGSGMNVSTAPQGPQQVWSRQAGIAGAQELVGKHIWRLTANSTNMLGTSMNTETHISTVLRGRKSCSSLGGMERESHLARAA